MILDIIYQSTYTFHLGKVVPGFLRFGFDENMGNLIKLGDDERELLTKHLPTSGHFFVVI